MFTTDITHKVRKSISGYQTLRGERNKDWLLIEYRISFWGDRNVLQLDSSDGYNNIMNVLNATESYILKGLPWQILCYAYFATI